MIFDVRARPATGATPRRLVAAALVTAALVAGAACSGSNEPTPDDGHGATADSAGRSGAAATEGTDGTGTSLGTTGTNPDGSPISGTGSGGSGGSDGSDGGTGGSSGGSGSTGGQGGSSGGDGVTTTSTRASGVVTPGAEDFCATYAELNQKMAEMQPTSSDDLAAYQEQILVFLKGAFAQLVSTAPDDIKADVERMNDALQQAQTVADLNASQGDAELLAASDRLDAWVPANCGFDTLDR